MNYHLSTYPRGYHPQLDHTTVISQALGSFIESKSATFACGGSVAIEGKANADRPAVSVSPVTLRWDTKLMNRSIAKLQFPLNPYDEADSAALTDLVHDCQPARFGFNGDNILDETYRKATKMDRSAFSVDFCPYESGIIDTVAQLLVANSESRNRMNGVRAELYKLNIYAAPSGFFKAHVDTPRSAMQFGSLVVSLPCYHKGGQLIVRHAQHSTTFDWATDADKSAAPAVHWAAFYSDCEHEVLQVTDGYRITLTYNLYHAPGVGDLAGNSVPVDMRSLPLFKHVRAALNEHGFMTNGGRLGIFCQHAYAHTHEDRARALPAVLKGSDMAVYTVFQALGLRTQVRAILDLRHKTRSDSLNDFFSDRMEREEENAYLSESEEYEMEPLIFQTHSVVGSLGGYGVSEAVVESEEDMENVVKEWVRESRGSFMKIVWVNEPHHSGLDMTHLTHGNEAGIGTLYSHAALLVDIPPATMRFIGGEA